MTTYSRTDIFYPKTETRLSDKEMLSLKNRYDNFNPKVELNKICQHVFKTNYDTFEQIVAWGLDHLLYTVILPDKSEYVIRLNNTTIGDDYFEVEQIVYQKLIDAKVQDCKMYHLERREDGNFPYDFIILDNLQTADFEKQLENGVYTKEQELLLVKESGKLLKKIHSISTEKFGFFEFKQAKEGKLIGELDIWRDYFNTASENNLKTSYDLGFVSKELLNRTETILARYDYLLDDVKPVLLHGDYCDHNIMSKDMEITGAIDLTDSMSGDYLHDIAFWLSFYDFDRLNFFLNGYFEDEKESVDYKSLTTKLYFYLLRINYSKAILRYKYGISEKIPLAIEKIEASLAFLEKINYTCL